MNIHLRNVGKKFSHEWLFRNIDISFSSGSRYALTGPNGSGKSTLIQLIAGNQLCSEGTIEYYSGEAAVPAEEIFRHTVISAPYLELIEEFSLTEAIDFHFRFKEIRKGFEPVDLINIGMFGGSENKYIRNFSSGMKQRLKLLLAFYSRADILLLDEPTTNLDEQGVKWYTEHVTRLKEPLIIVASNQPHEYNFCDDVFSLSNLKA